jgi:hypothetical protein
MKPALLSIGSEFSVLARWGSIRALAHLARANGLMALSVNLDQHWVSLGELLATMQVHSWQKAGCLFWGGLELDVALDAQVHRSGDLHSASRVNDVAFDPHLFRHADHVAFVAVEQDSTL